MAEILKFAKKVRKKLLYFIDTEIRKNSERNNNVLIDSKSPKELTKNYQKFSDFRMNIIETYNGCRLNAINPINYFHVSITYSSFNNNYQIWYENKSFDMKNKEENNIVGSYLEENKINLKKNYDREKISFNAISKNNKKKMIGNKKFSQRRKRLYSSVDIPKNMIMIMDENNSDIFKNNKKYIDKLDDDNKMNNNDDKNETVCANKKRRLKVNYYENKLKKYCSNFIILKKRRLKSPKKKYKKNNTLKQEKVNINSIETPNIKTNKDIKDIIETKFPISIKSQHKQKFKNKEKSTKISEKKYGHDSRERALSIKDTNNILNVVKNYPKRIYSPKKNSVILHDSKPKETSQKIARKEREKNFEDVSEVRKMISGGIKSKRKMFAEKATIKWNNKIFQMDKVINTVEQAKAPRRPIYKRANTLNKVNNIFRFKGNEIKFKEH